MTLLRFLAFTFVWAMRILVGTLAALFIGCVCWVTYDKAPELLVAMSVAIGVVLLIGIYVFAEDYLSRSNLPPSKNDSPPSQH